MAAKERQATDGERLVLFACPNPDCDKFNQFDAGNLSVVERIGKHKAIRRLYCSYCQQRFSERKGSLLEYVKLPKQAVVRMVKCLGHGCSIEATSDICEVDARTVERLLARAGPRAMAFHQLQIEHRQQPIEAVELDELHAHVAEPRKKGALSRSRLLDGVVARIAAWAGTGCMRP